MDFLVDRAPESERLGFTFFGGEPFLERSLMEEVIRYALARRPDGLQFSTPTNGTLLDESALSMVRDN